MEKPVLVIIAGGKSSSFAPLVTTKSLVPFLGKPVIQHTIEWAKQIGFQKVIVVTNQQNEQWLNNYQLEGLEIVTKVQTKQMGMADAVLTVEEEIGNNPVIIKGASDIVEDSIITALLEKAASSYATITARKVDTYFPGGYLQINGDRVMSIIEKPGKGTEPSDLVSITAHYFSQPKDFIELIKQHDLNQDDCYEQALNKLMQEKTINFVTYAGPWKKLKYSFHVLDVMDYFLSTIHTFTDSSAQVSDKATITGEVYIDEGAKIYEGAVIIGPAYIGKNAMVGQHTLVRHAMIEEGAIVGHGSEVARSYIGPRSNLHHNYIGDSVLEADVNPSYGTCTANLRLDNKNVVLKLPEKTIESNHRKLGAIVAKGAFLGINCSLMPGITIGENGKVYPGSVVLEAVAANSTYKKE